MQSECLPEVRLDVVQLVAVRVLGDEGERAHADAAPGHGGLRVDRGPGLAILFGAEALAPWQIVGKSLANLWQHLQSFGKTLPIPGCIQPDQAGVFLDVRLQ